MKSAPPRNSRGPRAAGRRGAAPGLILARSTREEAERLIDVVGRFDGQPVTVLGDLVADEFVYGDIARVSREAPVLILEHRRTVVAPGGGGNAVANLQALGAEPFPVGVVGTDEQGRRLVGELKRAGIDCSGIVSHASHSTPTKSRILAGGVHTRRQQVVRLDRGAPRGELSQKIQSALRGALKTSLRRSRGLLVADYGYGSATPELVDRFLPALRRQSIPVLVDSRSRVAAYRKVTACTPNQEELERALDLDPLDELAAVEAAGRALVRRTGDSAVLLTRGARGMCLFERGRRPLHVPTYGSDEVADVTGAGDTVIAVFALALLAGADFRDASRLSNYAAGLVVMKAGTATLRREELARAVREDLTP